MLRRWMRSCALVGMLQVSAAAAVPQSIGIFSSENPGDIHRCWNARAFELFNFYVIGFSLGEFKGWEASVSLSEPGWNILGATLNPATAHNVGSIGNFIVGLGGVSNGTPRFTLVSYQAGWFQGAIAPSDVQVCLGAATPTTFPGDPGPAIGNAQGEAIRIPFLQGQTKGLGAGCAGINPSDGGNCFESRPVSSSSWSGVKSRYGGGLP